MPEGSKVNLQSSPFSDWKLTVWHNFFLKEAIIRLHISVVTRFETAYICLRQE